MNGSSVPTRRLAHWLAATAGVAAAAAIAAPTWAQDTAPPSPPVLSWQFEPAGAGK